MPTPESRHQFLRDRNHRIQTENFATSAARLAATGFAGQGVFTSDDIDRVAKDEDTGAFYRLASIGPIVWSPLFGGGGGGLARDELTRATAALAVDATENAAISLPRCCLIHKITLSAPCRVRLYGTAAARAGDAARAPATQPPTGQGLHLEFYQPTGAFPVTFNVSPIAAFANQDAVPGDAGYVAIQNKGLVAGIVAVTFGFLILEP